MFEAKEIIPSTKIDLLKTPFFKDLQPAKWRNLPFGVSSIALSLGRKIAVHEYPYTDGVFAEDLGAKGKAFHVMGLLLKVVVLMVEKALKEQIIELEKIAMQWGMVNLFIPLWGLAQKCACLI
jgi:prophage DNA circulation protein